LRKLCVIPEFLERIFHSILFGVVQKCEKKITLSIKSKLNLQSIIIIFLHTKTEKITHLVCIFFIFEIFARQNAQIRIGRTEKPEKSSKNDIMSHIDRTFDVFFFNISRDPSPLTTFRRALGSGDDPLTISRRALGSGDAPLTISRCALGSGASF